METTKGTGIDIILHSSDEMLHASWQCVAEFGTLVNICPKGREGDENLELGNAKRNVARIDVDLTRASRHRPDLLAR